MKIFDLILLDISLIITPILIYLIYTAYIKVIDKKEDKLIFIIITFLQLYLIYKYSMPLNIKMPILIVDIPLLLSYNKNNKTLSILISIINITYYYSFYENHLVILIVEYTMYFYILVKEKNIEKQIIAFWIIKIIFLTYYKYINIEVIIASLASFFTSYLLKKSEEILSIHSKIKKNRKRKATAPIII